MTQDKTPSTHQAVSLSPQPRLVVIDESRVFAASIREIAEDLGYQVETSIRIGEVMQACRVSPPEVVLIGHMSPEVDALELIAWLCEAGSVVKLLVLTDGTRRYSDVRRLVTRWGGRLAVEAHPRPLGAKVLRAALARQAPAKEGL